MRQARQQVLERGRRQDRASTAANRLNRAGTRVIR